MGYHGSRSWLRMIGGWMKEVFTSPPALLAFVVSAALTFGFSQKYYRKNAPVQQAAGASENQQGNKKPPQETTSAASQQAQQAQLQPQHLRLSCDLIAVQPAQSHE